jgi:hypothetical protein
MIVETVRAATKDNVKNGVRREKVACFNSYMAVASQEFLSQGKGKD